MSALTQEIIVVLVAVVIVIVVLDFLVVVVIVDVVVALMALSSSSLRDTLTLFVSMSLYVTCCPRWCSRLFLLRDMLPLSGSPDVA